MEKNLNKIAEELFEKIRSRFPSIKLGDKESKVTNNAQDARFFEFGYVTNNAPLGTVTISLNDNDMSVMYSNNIVEDADESVKSEWFDFMRGLREFAKQRFMNFDVRDIAKTNLEKRDYEQLASTNIGEQVMSESKLWGTSRLSYQNIGEARLVIKHNNSVSDMVPASRARYIESIYIENADGERFKYPYKHLNGARAMARHIANGGTPYDTIGEHVVNLSEELGKLNMFKRYVSRNDTIAEAMGDVNEKVIGRINEVKKEIQQLQKQAAYESFVESFEADTAEEIPEDLVNNWVDKLTVRRFNEDLKDVFPFIYKLVSEDDMPNKGIQADAFKAFESSIAELASLDSEKTEEQQLSVNALNELLSEPLPVGTDGINAIESLQDIIDDKELNDIFKEYADLNPQADARDLIMDYIKLKDEEKGTNVASQLNVPEEAPAQEPVGSVPAEGVEEDAVNEEYMEVLVKDIMDRVRSSSLPGKLQMKLLKLLNRKDLGMQDVEKVHQWLDDHGVNESSANIEKDEVFEFVESMFDKETGNFPKGETGVLLSVEKRFGESSVARAQEAIQQLVSITESYRIRKLAGM